MEQVRKNPSPYVVPGTTRMPMEQELSRKVIATYGTKWFLSALLDIICKELEVSKVDIHSMSRKAEIVMARHLFRYYGWELMNSFVSLNDVALFVSNGRMADHSSVIRSRKIIQESINSKDAWADKILQYMFLIDSRLNQITIDEDNSTNRKSRQR